MAFDHSWRIATKMSSNAAGIKSQSIGQVYAQPPADLRRRIIRRPDLLVDGRLIVAAHCEHQIGEEIGFADPDTGASYRGAIIGPAERIDWINQRRKLGDRSRITAYVNSAYRFYRVAFD